MQVLLLSQEFHLDELVSLEYLLEAYDQVRFRVLNACSGVRSTSSYYQVANLNYSVCCQGGDVSAEAAAGLFFEQRKSMLLALRRLLAVSLMLLLFDSMPSFSNASAKHSPPKIVFNLLKVTACAASCLKVRSRGKGHEMV